MRLRERIRRLFKDVQENAGQDGFYRGAGILFLHRDRPWRWRVLLGQRTGGAFDVGLWNIPTGEVELGGKDRDAWDGAVRELAEEFCGKAEGTFKTAEFEDRVKKREISSPGSSAADLLLAQLVGHAEKIRPHSSRLFVPRRCDHRTWLVRLSRPIDTGIFTPNHEFSRIDWIPLGKAFGRVNPCLWPTFLAAIWKAMRGKIPVLDLDY